MLSPLPRRGLNTVFETCKLAAREEFADGERVGRIMSGSGRLFKRQYLIDRVDDFCYHIQQNRQDKTIRIVYFWKKKRICFSLL